MSEAPFYVDRGKTGRAVCKGCKALCLTGELRLAKIVPSPYGDNQAMKSWFHVDCFISALLKQRLTTKRVDSINDIGNWHNLSSQDKSFLLDKFNECERLYAEKHPGKYAAKKITDANEVKHNVSLSSLTSNRGDNGKLRENDKGSQSPSSDNKFSYFEKLCKKLAKADAHSDKISILNNFFKRGTDGISFKGDLFLWCKLLLPQVSNRVYNLKNKQLIKLFSKILGTEQDEMLAHLEKGDISETIQIFFSLSKTFRPLQESILTIQDVEHFLRELAKLTREEEQIYQFKKILRKCTLEDLKMIIRLIKGDLRINAGSKIILEGVHSDAYAAFQTSQDLEMVLSMVLSQNSLIKHLDASQQTVEAKLALMTPVLPMLAEACKSVEMAMKKCPNGMFSEIKYDGERVQVHKKGNDFKYFSRALKPVMAHKVNHFKEYLPKAFPKACDMILDAEVLLVDVKTGKPLPFGTLGIHKQAEFKDAQVCLFIFDCLYFNGNSLLETPIKERRKILEDNIVEIKNHVVLSEQKLIKKQADLAKMIAEVLQLGLEGLVLKDLESTYEPGKRHWLKVKKDYLFDGAMADTADLVVLGAWFGTGKKGGMMSIFLMGCLDIQRNVWVTVTKVHTGHDDATLSRLQRELGPLMVKISQDYIKLPSWIDCKKLLAPDFIASDPKKMPVWEITGTELTKASLHTADGISIRFPRVTRIRKDKNWETATNLEELRYLYMTSKQKTDVSLLHSIAQQTTSADYEPPKKRTRQPTSKSLQCVEPIRKQTSQKIPSRSIPSIDKYGLRKTPSKATTIDKFCIKKSPVKPAEVAKSPVKSNAPQRNKKKEESDNETISHTSLNKTLEKKNKTKYKVKCVPDRPLPIFFKNLRLGFYPDFISFPAEERNIFERHWIAYGGTVVKSIRAAEVDYILHNSDTISYQKTQKLKRKLPTNVKHVHKSWLIECINNLALLDTAKYAVSVVP